MAEILGVKRQTLNNRLKAYKLLSVKVGGESRFPRFQFDGLDEILPLLSSFSATTQVSFLTSIYFFEGKDKKCNVIEILKKYGRMSEKMQEICRQATFFGQQTSS